MFDKIKIILNHICRFLTWIINLGQRFFCKIDTKERYKVSPAVESKACAEDYKKFKAYMSSFGLPAPKREFKVFWPSMVEGGSNPIYMLPQETANIYVMPVLNPIPLREYFEDKNLFDKILPPSTLPKTILRRMGGKWYDAAYHLLSGEVLPLLNREAPGKEIVIKPSRHSSSGRGVDIFSLRDRHWVSKTTGRLLTDEEIRSVWGDNDLIVQEAFLQHEFMSQFNPTSVNTIRMYIYRSIADGTPRYIWSGVRIGGKGSVVDNSHSGGIMIGLNPDGEFSDYGFDQWGNRVTEFNGIDFKNSSLRLPWFEELQDFAFKCSAYLFPNRLIAFDLTIDPEGRPAILEYNLRGYAPWCMQFAGARPLGDYTDEILEYVVAHKELSRKFYYSIG